MYSTSLRLTSSKQTPDGEKAIRFHSPKAKTDRAGAHRVLATRPDPQRDALERHARCRALPRLGPLLKDRLGVVDRNSNAPAAMGSSRGEAVQAVIQDLRVFVHLVNGAPAMHVSTCQKVFGRGGGPARQSLPFIFSLAS